MFHNTTFKQQQGAALMLALFVMVLLAVVLASIATLRSNASQAVVYEVQGQRTLWLAKAQLELALLRLYPLNQASQACSAVTPSVSTWNTGSWQNCSSTISCTEKTIDSQRIVRLVSTAECGSNEQTTSRQLVVESAG